MEEPGMRLGAWASISKMVHNSYKRTHKEHIYIPVGTVGVGLVCVGMTVVVTESSTVCSENKIMQH